MIKSLRTILAPSRYVGHTSRRNEFTSYRNAYAEMILWRDSFSARTHVLEKCPRNGVILFALPSLFSSARTRSSLTFYSTNRKSASLNKNVYSMSRITRSQIKMLRMCFLRDLISVQKCSVIFHPTLSLSLSFYNLISVQYIEIYR